MILDTNALSAIANADSAITPAWTNAALIAIPVIVLGEYRYGIAQSRYRDQYETWLRTNLPSCLILNISQETADHYALVRVELRHSGKPIPANDIWIAALCREHNLPILSRDRHFDQVSGLRRLSW
ncbi:MAG: type II toxin-antitoxin system VapC family toxin [Bryobacteraceae bacterium]